MTAQPVGWVAARLGDISRAEYGKGLRAADRDASGKVPVYGSAGVVGYHSEALVSVPVVVVGRKGNAGACFLSAEPCWPIDTTYFVRVPSQVEPKFLAYQLEHASLRALDSSTAIPSLLRPALEAQLVMLAPLSEQRRIVGAIEQQFSRLDAADSSLRDARSRLAVLRRAVVVDSLEDHWPDVTVGEVATVDSGPAFKSAFFGGPNDGIRLLRGENIEPGRLRWRDTRTWPTSMLDGFEHLHVAETDLILAMDRPVISTGLKLASVKSSDLPALLVQRVARIRPSARISTSYLYAALQHPAFIPHLIGDQTGTQLPHITLAGIRSFQIRLPPPAEQARIVATVEERLSAVDALQDTAERSQRRSASLRWAILDRAFRGKLVEQDTADEPASALLERIRTESATTRSLSRRRRRVSA